MLGTETDYLIVDRSNGTVWNLGPNASLDDAKQFLNKHFGKHYVVDNSQFIHISGVVISNSKSVVKVKV